MHQTRHNGHKLNIQFTTHHHNRTTLKMRQVITTFSIALLSASALVQSLNLVVISPAGGIGETAAVSAAKRGNNVSWFVLQQQSRDKISLSEEMFGAIRDAGGSMELAGSSVESILAGDSARSAVGKWCSIVKPDAIICTADDIDGDNSNANEVYRAICFAAQEACKQLDSSCSKLAVINPSDEVNSQDEEQKSGFINGIFGSDDEGNSTPLTLIQALGANTMVLQYGELFGSPGAPAFIGGPRRDPILREEYVMEAVRIDPSSAAFGSDKAIRSSRLSVGEAATLMVTNNACKSLGASLCLTSLRGKSLNDGEWETEFERALSSSLSSDVLFEAEFSSVPSVPRLSNWLATKWFPAILKTFELATITTGARPVYAIVPEDGQVEIIWQQLKDLKSSNVGKIVIDVNNEGLVARRQIVQQELRQLPSESVVVRRLADATAQAIEKGLALKPIVKEKATLKTPAPSAILPVMEQLPTIVTVNKDSIEEDASGPRVAGARRSSQRARGRAKPNQDNSGKNKGNFEDDSSTWQ